MNATALLLVAVGGALGSVARALMSTAMPASRLPWPTIVVNVVGSLLIGALMARFAGGDAASTRAQSFWVVGVCGGFTTFSAFSYHTFNQLQKGEWLLAAANVVLSVTLCIAAAWLGWRLAR